MRGSKLAATLPRLERATGALATQSVARMDETLPWFRTLPADQRSWIALVAQAGVSAFVRWLQETAQPEEQATSYLGGASTNESAAAISANVFGDAPRELVRNLTLRQTLAMIKVTVDVAEEQVPHLAAPGEQEALHKAVLRYSREVAFAAAEVYAHAAETRGAWDTRLQALLVDALISDDPDDEIASRAAALGWKGVPPIAVAIGQAPDRPSEETLAAIAQAGRRVGIDVLASVHQDRLIVVVAGGADPVRTTATLSHEFGPGPIVVGDPVKNLTDATHSARSAEVGMRAVAAWPSAPRPVSANALLAERALIGDDLARRKLGGQVYAPLRAAGGDLLQTLSVYLETGCSLEATARELYVHPNTVRYRLRRVNEICGYSPSDPHSGFTLHIALALGKLTEHE